MLGKRDFAKELGKNLLIYPFSIQSLDDSSYSLHASKFAWKLEEKVTAVSDDETTITIPANKTVLVVTEESVSLQKKLSGICCSGVSNATSGLTICTTPIKCGWIGRLIITIHNTTASDIAINVGSKISVLIIDRLYTKAKGHAQNQNKKTENLLTKLFPSIKIDSDDISPHHLTDIDAMKSELINDEQYKTFQKSQPKRWWLFALSLVVVIASIILAGERLGYENVLPVVIGSIVTFILGWWMHSFFT